MTTHNGKPLPPPGCGFDDDGDVVAVVNPWDLSEPEQQEARREVLSTVLDCVYAGDTPSRTGAEVILMAHLVGRSGCRNLRELSAKLGWSLGKTSAELNRVREKFPGLARVERGQRKEKLNSTGLK